AAAGDAIPMVCVTGQGPVARLHKEAFQAGEIASIAGPVTKMAMTVLEPAQVPGAFQQAFHLMRSGRPGPVLLDLPFDVQMAEIEFDPDTYEPLPVHKPRATRAQAAKALDLLQRADPDRPGVPARLRHRLGRRRGAGTAHRGGPGPARRRPTSGLVRLGRAVPGAQADPAAAHPLRERADQASAGVRGDEQGVRPG